MGEVIGGQEGGFLQAGAFYHRIRLLRRQRRTDFLYVTAALQQWRRDAPRRAVPRRTASSRGYIPRHVCVRGRAPDAADRRRRRKRWGTRSRAP